MENCFLESKAMLRRAVNSAGESRSNGEYYAPSTDKQCFANAPEKFRIFPLKDVIHGARYTKE